MNGVLTFELESKSYTLRFGMIATEIFSKKAVREMQLMDDRGDVDQVASDFKAFVACVYAGLCNQADFIDEQYPKWGDVFELTELIVENQQLQLDIWEAFKNSRPAKALFERLSPEQVEKKKKLTGKK